MQKKNVIFIIKSEELMYIISLRMNYYYLMGMLEIVYLTKFAGLTSVEEIISYKLFENISLLSEVCLRH